MDSLTNLRRDGQTTANVDHSNSAHTFVAFPIRCSPTKETPIIPKTPQWALERIQKAHTSQATELDLSGLYQDSKLSAFPPEIGHLSVLQSLDLRFNKLSALPPEIGHLSVLQSLDLRYNKLSVLPPEIGQLNALQSLDLSENHLSALPPEIG